ncbi:hypothetical protein, partial [Thiolapillus sp.]|uniref:hypothetical protein n=2 Tax=Thiolapillus sp. TaxID=2017437 RepID=UPI003AF64DD2
SWRSQPGGAGTLLRARAGALKFAGVLSNALDAEGGGRVCPENTGSARLDARDGICRAFWTGGHQHKWREAQERIPRQLPP